MEPEPWEARRANVSHRLGLVMPPRARAHLAKVCQVAMHTFITEESFKSCRSREQGEERSG
jgi:hypothetical protein